MSKSLSQELQAQAQELLKHYPEPAFAILPVFHLAQSEFGLIDEEAEKMVAELCGISQVRAHSVWSFYHMFARQPRGKYHIRVCHNVSCTLLGAEDLIAFLLKRIGLEQEGTSADGLFSLERVECLGACGGAPAMLVNEDLYENLTEEKIDKILADLRNKM
jgi:NADH-quinone oxidoreductase E subunit